MIDERNDPPANASSGPQDTQVFQPVVSDKPPKQKKKLLLLLLVIFLLIAAGIGAWLYLQNPKTKPSSTATTTNSHGTDFKVAPRFNEVNGYAKFGGSEWYAVDGGVIRTGKGSGPTYYTQRDGVPLGPPTALAVHNNTLWLSTQNGVATLKADRSGFDAVKVSNNFLNNGQLYEDASSNTLYLLSFEQLYSYDDAAKVWKAMPGSPKALSYFVANKNFLIGSVNGSGMPVWIYDKATAKWSLQKPNGIDNDAVQMVFTVGGDIFSLGRTNGYTSCNQQGKITANSVAHLDPTGKWQPVTDFNSDLSRPELLLARHVKDPTTAFYTSPCSSEEPRTTYSVSYTNNTLKLAKTGTLPEDASGAAGDDGEQQTLVDELHKATGLYPFIHVLAVDKGGNLIFSYSTKADRSSTPTPVGIAKAKGTDFAQATSLNVADNDHYDTLTPIMCDGTLRYLFAGTFAHESHEGFPNGQWSKTLLLRVNSSDTATFADLQNDVGEPRFACAGGKINWVGRTAVQQLDVASKKISSSTTVLPTTTAQQSQSVVPLDNGDMWLLLSTDQTKQSQQAKLYYFASASQNVKPVGTYEAVALLGGDTVHAWVARSYGGSGGDTFSGLDIYDSAGNKVRKDIEFLRLGASGDQAIVAQVGPRTDSIFVPFKAIKIAQSGSSTDIPASEVPVRELRPTYTPGTFSLGNNAGVLDPVHKRVWFSDDQLGSFAIDL